MQASSSKQHGDEHRVLSPSTSSVTDEIINQVHQHLFSTIYLYFRSSMDSVFQHGSSSGYIHDGPDFLIAQQHLQAVAGMLAGTTFQAMDADPRADATASLSAIRAILSPESREIHVADASGRVRHPQDTYSISMAMVYSMILLLSASCVNVGGSSPGGKVGESAALYRGASLRTAGSLVHVT